VETTSTPTTARSCQLIIATRTTSSSSLVVVVGVLLVVVGVLRYNNCYSSGRLVRLVVVR